MWAEWRVPGRDFDRMPDTVKGRHVYRVLVPNRSLTAIPDDGSPAARADRDFLYGRGSFDAILRHLRGGGR